MRFLAILAAASAFAQTPSLKQETVHGREAWVLENGRIRVSALRGGGHLAEIRLLSSDPRKAVNPMRVPHYPTIDPHQYQPAAHDALYGTGPHRWLSAGYMGHLLCFPAFGAPSSEDEVRNGLGNHGEAPIVEWKQLAADARDDRVTLRYGANLPKTQFTVERTITLRAGAAAADIEEWVENLASYDRPINWVQHATFGPPFVEPGKNVLDVSATRGLIGGGRPGQNSLLAGREIRWPEGVAPDGSKVSLREFQTVPRAGTYYALLLDPARGESYFTMYHADYPVLIGYLFPTADNPWIGDWQENQSNTTPPWGGKVVARGLEFGTSPMPEGLRKSVERATLFGVPTFRWIGGKQRLKTTFTVFLTEIPKGFAGVADVRRESGGIIVVERGSRREIVVTRPPG